MSSHRDSSSSSSSFQAGSLVALACFRSSAARARPSLILLKSLASIGAFLGRELRGATRFYPSWRGLAVMLAKCSAPDEAYQWVNVRVAGAEKRRRHELRNRGAGLERPRLHAVDILLEVLPDEVVIDEAPVGVAKLLRHRPPDLPLGADLLAVEARDRTDAQRRRSQEDLVGSIGVVKVDVGLAQRQARIAREIDHGRAADPGQHEFFPRREDFAVAHREDVRPHALAEIAVRVEQHRPGLGIDALDLLIGNDEIEIIVRLGARGERIRWYPAVRGDHHADALLEQLGALLERQRRAFEHYVGAVVV